MSCTTRAARPPRATWRTARTWANSAAEAAQGAELILTSLPGPKQVEEVALGEGGILQGAAKGAVYADLSTSSPTLIRRIYEQFAEQGVHVLDAPVSGGPVGAERATLQVMVGGDEEVYNRVRPALLGIGDKVSYIGRDRRRRRSPSSATTR